MKPIPRILSTSAVLVSFFIVSTSVAKSNPLFNRPIQNNGSWTLTDSMNTARINPMAVTLPSGKVLVAGGFLHSSNFKSAELWDPQTGRWSPTGSMHTDRSAGTLTVLPNGKVLAAAGFSFNGGETKKCELYNPTTGKWSDTGSMMAPRMNHTATLLADGRVLAAGGENGTIQIEALSTAEIYNPSTGKWTPTGDMNARRELHAASLLADGNVLVTGGDESFVIGTKGTTEIFNPSFGRWTLVGNMTSSRFSHAEFALADGTVIVAGGAYGVTGGYNQFASTNRYDPQKQRWSAVGDMQVSKDGVPTVTGRVDFGAALLADGRVIATGGIGHTNDWNALKVFQTAELYDPAFGSWTLTGDMHVAREQHKAVALLDGRALVIGGGTVNSATATAEVFTPPARMPFDRGFWPAGLGATPPRSVAYQVVARSRVSPRMNLRPSIGKFTTTGSLNFARAGSPAILLKNGKVLAEGCTSISSGGTSAELYDPATGKWSVTGSMHFSRCRHSAALLADGRVLVVGGDGGGQVAQWWPTTEIYDPRTGRWTVVGMMNSARTLTALAGLPNGKFLVAAGAAPGTTPRDSADLYDPASGIFTATPSLNLARYDFAFAALANGGVMVEGGTTYDSQPTTTVEIYDPSANVWRSTSPVHDQAPDLVLLAGGDILAADEVVPPTSQLYHPATKMWSATVGEMHFSRIGDTTTLLHDGRVISVGGKVGISGTLEPRSEIYDPTSGQWTLDAALSTPRYGQSAARLTDGRVLIVGGLIGFTPITSTEIYSP